MSSDALCPDCGVAPGVAHEDGCDVARCLHTGQQRLSCFSGHGFRKRRESDPPDRQPTLPGYVWCDVLDAIQNETDEIPPKVAVLMFPATISDDDPEPAGAPETICGCPPDLLHDDCGADVWTGEWPASAEAIEQGWYARFLRDPEAEKGAPSGRWEPCEPDAEGAVPDLNRVYRDMVWDREQRRFALPQPTATPRSPW